MQLSTPTPLPTAPLPSKGATCKKDYAVGTSIPANMAHAVSVSLPLWSDNIDYEEGRLSNSMETGYPRFFIHRSIQRLATLLCKKFARPHEACILFPSARIAERCRDFMRTQSTLSSPLPIRIVRFSMLEHAASNSAGAAGTTPNSSSSTAEHVSDQLESTHFQSSSTTAHYIFIVFFPEDVFSLAKSFWQHTGDGISSRQADRCLALLEQSKSVGQDAAANTAVSLSHETATTSKPFTTDTTSHANADDIYKKPASSASAGKRFYNRYTRTNSSASGLTGNNATPLPTSSTPQTPYSSGIMQRPSSVADEAVANALSASVSSLSGVTPASVHASASVDQGDVAEPASSDLITYLEERYGRNLPLTSAPSAKLALRRRIAGTLLSDRSEQSAAEAPGDQVGESGRTGTGVTEDDVYLFPCGMSAIYHAHQLAMQAAPRLVHANVELGSKQRQAGKSVCFGFPYTDTLKILQKFGPGCHFYGLGVDQDLESLEQVLQAQQQTTQDHDGSAPILALFCEFPSNPLLRSPNLARIRQLADRYNFLVCVDETIGNFVNVEVLPYADILVSSLTKVFSGDANVMGGSMVLNPKGPYYQALRSTLQEHYEDTYFDEDAIFMERNSRDFIRRIVRIDSNTRAVTSMLWREKLGEGQYPNVIKNLFYPRYETPENYDVCRRKKAFTALGDMGGSDGAEEGGGGYGGLFSVTFWSEAASQAFYDTLQCAKGPSLGTNLTLASPYTILAHYGELDWAAQFGVERGLVRVSVGLEDEHFLIRMFGDSLAAAARAHAATQQ